VTSPLPFRWARVTLAVAFVVLTAAVACGRVLTDPRACLDVVVDTAWAYNASRTDSVAALVTTCAEWDR
jgi:hypothetical protein